MSAALSTIGKILRALEGGKRLNADEIYAAEIFETREALAVALSHYSVKQIKLLRKKRPDGKFEYWPDPAAKAPDEIANADIRSAVAAKKPAPKKVVPNAIWTTPQQITADPASLLARDDMESPDDAAAELAPPTDDVMSIQVGRNEYAVVVADLERRADDLRRAAGELELARIAIIGVMRSGAFA